MTPRGLPGGAVTSRIGSVPIRTNNQRASGGCDLLRTVDAADGVRHTERHSAEVTVARWRVRQVSEMDDFGNARPQAVVRCPFYGFTWPEATRRLLHVPGNRCGLALDRFEPCAMEEAGREVDMDECPTAERLSHFIRSAGPVIAFITPEHPEGLSYTAWWRCTMVRGSSSM